MNSTGSLHPKTSYRSSCKHFEHGYTLTCNPFPYLTNNKSYTQSFYHTVALSSSVFVTFTSNGNAKQACPVWSLFLQPALVIQTANQDCLCLVVRNIFLYRIAENIGRELNLADWRIQGHTANLNPPIISAIKGVVPRSC